MPRPDRGGGRIVQLCLLCWEESRPIVQVTVLGRFLAGVALSSASGGHVWWRVAVAAVAWVAAGISAYLFNGAYDFTEDYANGSTRPVASGRLSVGTALRGACCAAAASVTAAVVSGIAVQAAAFLLLGYAYSGPPWPAKRHWASSSLVITASGALTFWAASTATGRVTGATIVAGAALAAWMGLVGALVKDLPDAAGDAIAGRRTYAVAFGIDRTGRYAGAMALMVGLCGTAASMLLAWAVLPAMLALLIGGAMIAARRARGRRARATGRKDIRALYRLFMLTQQTAIGLVVLSGIWYASGVIG